MALTNAERQRLWRERKRRQNRKSVTVQLSSEAFRLLRAETEKTGRDYSSVVNYAILKLLNSSGDFKIAEILSTDIRNLSENESVTSDTTENTSSVTSNESDGDTTENASSVTSNGFDFNKDFAGAYEMMEGDNHVFVTGRAGTGKSTLLRYFCENTRKNVAVVAPTGVAALNVGVTMHSFFHIPPRFMYPDEVKRISDSRRREMYKRLDTVVIDEISMVRADIMDVTDRFLRINRGTDKPFGGVQVIMVGDLFQLPPVSPRKKREADVFNALYPSPWFFDAHVFANEKTPFLYAELTKIYRQSDREFTRLLNAIRENAEPDLRYLNTRADQEIRPGEFYVTLAPTNAMVARINQAELGKIRERPRSFEARITGKFSEKDAPADVRLTLKKGDQVIFVKNDGDRRWVNGTVGRVVSLSENHVRVRTSGGTFSAEREKWEITDYGLNREIGRIEANVVGSFEQFPLRLAWAMTVHKSQGKTYERMILDTGTGMFAHGQLYVALSRCTSLNGLVIRKPVNERDVIVDSRVTAFHNTKRCR